MGVAQWRSQSLKHARAQFPLIIIYPYIFPELLLPHTSEQNNTIPLQLDSYLLL